ncbi:MAG: ribbon-helix-helix domain-containing protein [Rhodomicrobium sp.]
MRNIAAILLIHAAGKFTICYGLTRCCIYLDQAAHRVLKDLAEREDKKIQDLLFEGVNLMLQQYGEKPIA